MGSEKDYQDWLNDMDEHNIPVEFQFMSSLSKSLECQRDVLRRCVSKIDGEIAELVSKKSIFVKLLNRTIEQITLPPFYKEKNGEE